MFPNREAAEIAIKTVKDVLAVDTRIERVIFNVYKDLDKEIYEKLLAVNWAYHHIEFLHLVWYDFESEKTLQIGIYRIKLIVP